MDNEILEILKLLATGGASALIAIAGMLSYQTRRAKQADDMENSLIVDLRSELDKLRTDFDTYRQDAEEERHTLQRQVDKLIDSNEAKDKKIEKLEADLLAGQLKQAAQEAENRTLVDVFEKFLRVLPEAWSQQSVAPRTLV